MSPSPASAPVRLLSLDVLRALSLALVLWRHTADLPAGTSPLHTALLALRCGGWIGVDLFFVLSGFLVSGLLFREHQQQGSFRWGRFLVRRGFKIYPAFYLMIGLSILAAFHRGALEPKPALAELFFFQNYTPGLWVHTWSLAIEEHFYLLLPPLLLLLVRRGERDPFRLVPAAWAAVAGLLLAARSLNNLRPFGFWTHMMPTHLRIDSLMLGVAICWLFQYRPAAAAALQRHRLLLGLLALCLLWPAFFFDLETTPWITSIGFTAFAAGSGLLLVAVHGGLPTNAVTRALAYVGARSYSIYVWHLPLRYWVAEKLARRLGLGFGASTALYLVLSVAGGIALAAAVERPMLRLRDRFFPSGAAGRSEAITSLTAATPPAVS